MIDTHTHLQSEEFAQDLPEVLARARAAGVTAMVVPSIDHASFPRSLALTSEPDVYCAIGIHPHHANEFTDSVDEEMRSLSLSEKKIVAIGEIGLDYHYDYAPRDVQQHAFRKQLRIAKSSAKPAIIHNRESDEDIISMLTEEQDGTLRFQLHCFSSTKEVLASVLGLGAMISFTGNITFAKSTLAPIVEATPIERIMIETDAPYLAPHPLRGKRNEPANVKLVAEKIASIKNISLHDVITSTTQNARKFFGIISITLSLVSIGRSQSIDSVQSAPPLVERYAGVVPSVFIGAFAGSQNVGLEIQRPTDVRTTQFAYGGEIGARVTERLEVQFFGRWQSNVISNFTDVPRDTAFKHLDPGGATQLDESVQMVGYALNLHYIINPRARIQFHVVLGSEQLNFLIRQHYAFLLDTANRNDRTVALREQSHRQYAVALGLGIRLPIEAAHWYVTPYAQLSIGLAFNANTHVNSFFALRPDQEALTTTSAVAGVMISPPLFR